MSFKNEYASYSPLIMLAGSVIGILVSREFSVYSLAIGTGIGYFVGYLLPLLINKDQRKAYMDQIKREKEKQRKK